MEKFRFDTIEEAIGDFKEGKMVIVVDDGDVENDGALAVAGQFATAEAVNFMLTYGRGKMTMPVSEDAARQIGVSELIWENREMTRSTRQMSTTSWRDERDSEKISAIRISRSSMTSLVWYPMPVLERNALR